MAIQQLEPIDPTSSQRKWPELNGNPCSVVNRLLLDAVQHFRVNCAESKWWWKTIAPDLAILLLEADYTFDAQVKALCFLKEFVAPNMGPRPVSIRPFWKSFMTDDYTPVEYSWKWSKGDSAPDVRYSIEAISRLAGTEVDPMNQSATINLFGQLLGAIPDLDLTSFRHFFASLVGVNAPLPSSTIIQPLQTTLFTAFEIGRDGSIGVKAYFVPVPSPNLTPAQQIIHAIKSFDSSKPASIQGLEAFLSNDWAGKTITPIMLGIDCIHPTKSRLKIYGRSSLTSFNFVKHVMSLGGLRNPQGSEEEQLKGLWYQVLGLPADFPVHQELPQLDHITAGILFYFDVGPSAPIPDVKVYIPVRHYAKSDAQITRDLIEFQQRNGRGKFADGYKRVIEQLSTNCDMESGTGVHTYVTAAYTGDTLTVTSYLNPQIYHLERWS
ncbi:hypothetical protein CVT24_007424 [Panaeolus cyanescens]|uniref:Aromatic prenyltransferase n=1 Tax=Panaeolus cyanescens TaxID=181874 RepID=A0A409YL03_9AGAR|nr:hypothetical protein CVT24_007424 [Panaeolus cyanescens]